MSKTEHEKVQSYPQRNDDRIDDSPPLDEFPSAVAPLEQTSSCVSLSTHSCPLLMRYKIILLNVYSAKIRILHGICLISLKLLRIFNEKRALTSQSQPSSIFCYGKTHITPILSNILLNALFGFSLTISSATSLAIFSHSGEEL